MYDFAGDNAVAFELPQNGRKSERTRRSDVALKLIEPHRPAR
jgi:hypothetical protein